jgi:hypothetical protein
MFDESLILQPIVLMSVNRTEERPPMTHRLTLIVTLAGFGFIGLSQPGYSETRLLTLDSDSSATGDSPLPARRVPSEGNDFVAAQMPYAANSFALTSGGSNGDPGTTNQVNQPDPGNAALEASRVAEPPRSRLRSFLSSIIQFGAAASVSR